MKQTLIVGEARVKENLRMTLKKPKRGFILFILFLIVIPHSHLRQAMLDNIGGLVATVIMVLMALTIVTLKVSQDINILNQGSIFKVEKNIDQ